MWFLVSVWVTRRTLQNIPYASHRFQQLCYRFFLFQKMAIVVFVVALDAIPVLTFLVAYIRNHG